MSDKTFSAAEELSADYLSAVEMRYEDACSKYQAAFNAAQKECDIAIRALCDIAYDVPILVREIRRLNALLTDAYEKYQSDGIDTVTMGSATVQTYNGAIITAREAADIRRRKREEWKVARAGAWQAARDEAKYAEALAGPAIGLQEDSKND